MSVVFLISDFITDEEGLFTSPEMRLLASHHDLIAVVLEDPSEVALPPGGGYIRIREPETGAYRVVGLSDRTRAAYAESVAKRRDALVKACYRLPAECVLIQSDKSASEPLLELLARRRQR